MAFDKAVDSALLDGCLTNVARAIRGKTGGTEPLAFPADFVSAIQGIETGGTDDRFKRFIESGFTEISDDSITNISEYAFYCRSKLKSVSFPNVTYAGKSVFESSAVSNVNLPKLEYSNMQYGFKSCKSLESISLPECRSLGSNWFQDCTELKEVDLPKLSSTATSLFGGCQKLTSVNTPNADTIADNTFRLCYALSIIDLPKATWIRTYCMTSCYSLKAVVLRNLSKVCSLENTNAFTSCCHYYGTVNSTHNPNGDKDGYIYVPSALIEDYKVATNWSTFATQFRAIEDYTVDGTVDGEMDWVKMGVEVTE